MVSKVRSYRGVVLLIVAVVSLTSCDEQKTIYMQAPEIRADIDRLTDDGRGGRTIPDSGRVTRHLNDALSAPGHRDRPCVNPDGGRHDILEEVTTATDGKWSLRPCWSTTSMEKEL